MADMQSPQHPLEVLPAMLNLVVSYYLACVNNEYSHALAIGNV